jgi:predicted Zn finger-like uncharacterized protein
MPVKTACPACQTPYTLADAMRGKKVRCKQCQRVFDVIAAAADLAIKAEAVPAGRSAAPARARGGATPPPFDLPPEDSRASQLPRRRGSEPQDRPQSNAMLWILLASGGGVLLLAGIVITIILVARSSNEEPPPFVPPGPVAQQMPPINFPNLNGPGPGGQLPVFPNPGQKPFEQEKPPRQAPALLKTASTRFAIDPQDNHIDDVFFAPQAGQVGCYHWDGKNFSNKRLALYDMKTGQRMSLFEFGKDGATGHVELNADATRIARMQTGIGQGNALSIWSLPDGKPLFEKWKPYPKQELIWFAFLDRDRLLTMARSGQYDLFNMTQRQTIYSKPPAQGATRIVEYDYFARRPKNFAISLDRKVLALSNKNGFDLIDTATGNVLRRTPALDVVGKVGNEWSLAFSPDGKHLAAKLNLFVAGNKQQEYVLVWEVASGQQRAMFPLVQNLSFAGPLVWWGPKHLVLCNSNWTEGQLFSLADGQVWRVCERGGLGKLAGGSPDGRLWCATAVTGFKRAEIGAVELPVDQLQQLPAAGQQPPRWYIRPDGISTKRGV